MPALAQQPKPTQTVSYTQTSIAVGYNYSFSKPNPYQIHLVELEVWHAKYGPKKGIFNWYYGSEIGLNTQGPLVGPKIGGFIGSGFIIFGGEFVYYNNFQQGTLRFVPYVGYGYNQFKVSVNPHLRLLNQEFEPVNRGQLNITVMLFPIKHEIDYSSDY